ncbi:Phage portal protein [Poriferisphaera corsica]|uniref:Phage portal protein n=1 Tax=Poriferisphaera corsica TaxID=2528020 RepID=A0A517YU65_9BACT|nr:phage portal protein [Poriferisphaera corsica]QDU33761.1 Phage portal protein [Poriferisphaera corsica]
MDDNRVVEYVLSQIQRNIHVTVDEKSTLSLDVVESGIEAMSSPHETLPLHVYEKQSGRSVVINHQLDTLLNYPTPILTRQHFVRAMNTDLVLHGNAFAEIVRSGNKIVMLNQIDSKWFGDIKFDSKTKQHIYIFKIGDNTASKKIWHKDIIHLRWNPRGSLGIGEGLLKRGEEDLRLNLGLRQFLKNKVGDGFSDRVTASHSKEMQSDEVQQVREIMKKYRDDRDKIPVLDERVKIDRTESSLKDNVIDVLLSSSEKRLANRFKFPLHYFNIFAGNASYNSLEIETNRYKNKLIPWGKIWCGELGLKLLTPTERRTHSIRYNYDALVRVNLKDQVEVLEKQLNNGILTQNEVRGMMNQPSVGASGDIMRSPLNIGYADERGLSGELLKSEVERFARRETNAIAKKFKSGKHYEVMDEKTKATSQHQLYEVLRQFEPTHRFDAKKISEQAIYETPLADFDTENQAKYMIARWSQILQLIKNNNKENT